MTNTRVRIDLDTGIIELEGSEEFVTKYLDEFKAQVSSRDPSTCKESPSQQNTKTPKPKAKSKPNGDSKTNKKKRGAAKISPEKFDIHGDGDTPSLKDFFDEKKPGRANGDRIAVIGLYITELLGCDQFTEGQIEYAYRMLKLDRPAHLHQIMINTKNDKDLYEETEDDGAWTITRTGEIFVSDELPKSAE